MKLITKTPKKVVIEVKESRLTELGFDGLWDDIRKSYPLENYELFSIIQEGKSMFIEFDLKKKKLKK